MSKNREQLDLEAKELGIDTSAFETKAEVQDAIESFLALNPNLTPIEDVSEDILDETFETNEKVTFTVDGIQYEGTSFSFPSNVVEDRKRIVIDSYGKGVIKE